MNITMIIVAIYCKHDTVCFMRVCEQEEFSAAVLLAYAATTIVQSSCSRIDLFLQYYCKLTLVIIVKRE